MMAPRLSSLLTLDEANVFTRFAAGVKNNAVVLQSMSQMESGLVESLEKALREALSDPRVRVTMKGSRAKGTETMSSDTDVVVETPGRSVCRADKDRVVERLCKMPGFHPAHCKMKRLAIGCIYAHTEVDIVFASTAEYGELPVSLAPRFEGNVAAQHAARMLKVAIQQAVSTRLPEKVPSFVLEALVLEAQAARDCSSAAPLGDGSMELFVGALQMLCDSTNGEALNDAQKVCLGVSKCDGMRGRELELARCSSLRKHAAEMLHNLCASRFYAPDRAFTTFGLMELWLRHFGSRLGLQSPLGQIPSWVAGHVAPDDAHVALLHLQFYYTADPGPDSSCFDLSYDRQPFFSEVEQDLERACCDRPLEEIKSVIGTCQAARIFLENPLLAKYTQAGAKMPSPPSISSAPPALTADLDELRVAAINGSNVARRMRECRVLWMNGLLMLRSNADRQAVANFAAAARIWHADGDSFTGLVLDPRRIHAAVNSVLLDTATEEEEAVGAILVRCAVLLQENKFGALATEIERCVQIAPDDFSVWNMRMTVRGNLADWAGSLLDAERCIEIRPSEPISHFWRGVALRNLGRRAEERAALRRFIATADPEGRKVCQAWWDLALSEAHTGRKDRVGVAIFQGLIDNILPLARCGFEAEQKMLPLLRRYEANKSDAKKMCAAFLSLDQSPKAAARSSSTAQFGIATQPLRDAANAKFRASCFEEAAELYGKLVARYEKSGEAGGSASELHSRALSNRSAAHLKLREYNAAERDAIEVVRLDPGWTKGHVRLARARISKLDRAGALEALDGALARARDDAAQLLEVEGIRAEALELPADLPPRIDPRSLDCWSSVLYENSVVVVDARGSGDFVSLREAVVSSMRRPTSIVVSAGTFGLSWPMAATQYTGLALQIIGEGPPDAVWIKGELGRVEGLVCVSGPSSRVSLTSLKLENQTLGGSVAHCVIARRGANVELDRCRLSSTGAACGASEEGSTIKLVRCRLTGPGSGTLAADRGRVEARDCQFSGNRACAVEVRGHASCLLETCKIVRCAVQAVSSYASADTTLRDCVIEDCGAYTRCGAVMLSSGTLRLERCKVKANRGDGIVVEDDDDTSCLVVTSSMITRNGGQGVVLYGGAAEISDSRIQENAGPGGFVAGGNAGAGNRPFRSVSLTRNVIRGNKLQGTPSEIRIYDAKNDDLVLLRRRVNFEGNDSGPAILIARNRTELVPTFNNHEMAALNQRTPLGPEEIAAVHFQKQALVDAHERSLDRAELSVDERGTLLAPPRDYGCVDPQNDVAGHRRRSPDMRVLRDCSIADLSLGQRATGRVLRGVLCTRPRLLKGLYTILGDSDGAGVALAIYNAGALALPHWNQCFPKHARLAIKEPYLKRFADGIVGVRVDDPGDISITCCAWRECRVARLEDGPHFQRCNRCKSAMYCSRACQRRDWKGPGGHKARCQPCSQPDSESEASTLA